MKAHTLPGGADAHDIPDVGLPQDPPASETARTITLRGGDTVKKTLLLALLACACLPSRAWAQPPADCKPNALNIPGAPYPCIFPDSRVIFRVAAADAQKVTVRLGGGFEMS